MHFKRGHGVVKIWRGGKLEVTTSNRPVVVDRGGSLGQKGLEAEVAHFYLPFKPESILPRF